jgi:DNA/RNA-binding domain of Phe-tRNA-synthetase-like protein
MSARPEVETGWVSDELRDEFPELQLRHLAVAARPGRTPREVKDRLRTMSNRFTGARAVGLRQEPVPWAYRVFFRQVGIDPDQHRTPVEAAALERMRAGGFASRNLLDDALLIAVVETGVHVVAFDADRVQGAPGLRLSEAGEVLGGPGGRPLSDRQVLVADEARPLGVLFGAKAEGVGVHPETERMLLVTVQVKGVSDLEVEEALWTVVEVLRAAG